VGFYLPWWSLAILALVVGAWRFDDDKAALKVGLVSAASWIGTAASFDLVSGGRLSARISAVMHMPMTLAAYLAVGLVAFSIAGLAAQLGSSLRRALLTEPLAETPED
jgi:hypothetical protein